MEQQNCPNRTVSDRCSLTNDDCFKDMPITEYCPMKQKENKDGTSNT